MFIDTTEFVKFMIRHNIRADQVLFIYLVYMRRLSDITLLFKSPLRGFSHEVIKDLEDRGYIQDLNQAGEKFADMFIISDTLINDLFMDTDFPAEQFWEAYPSHMYIQDKRVPIRGVPKDTFLSRYMSKIRRNPNIHRKVMKALEREKAEGGVNMRIDNWFFSESWKTTKDTEGSQQTTYGTKEL